MAYADAVAAEPGHLAIVEVYAVREPGPVVEPAALLQIVHRPAAETLDAVVLFVDGLAQMRVKPAIAARRKRGAFLHQPRRNREGRARRKRHLPHRAVCGVVIARNYPFAVGQDDIDVLNDAVRRQAAILLRQVHGTARQGNPHAECLCLLRLDVHRILDPRGVEILMVARGGAAAHEEFRQCEPRRQPERVAVHGLRPDRIERDQPVEQFLVDGVGMGARQRLVEMVVRVDKPGNDHVPGAIEHLVHRRRWLASGGHQFGNPRAVGDNAATRCFRHDRQRLPEPDSPAVHIPVLGAQPVCSPAVYTALTFAGKQQ